MNRESESKRRRRNEDGYTDDCVVINKQQREVVIKQEEDERMDVDEVEFHEDMIEDSFKYEDRPDAIPDGYGGLPALLMRLEDFDVEEYLAFRQRQFGIPDDRMPDPCSPLAMEILEHVCTIWRSICPEWPKPFTLMEDVGMYEVGDTLRIEQFVFPEDAPFKLLLFLEKRQLCPYAVFFLMLVKNDSESALRVIRNMKAGLKFRRDVMRRRMENRTELERGHFDAIAVEKDLSCLMWNLFWQKIVACNLYPSFYVTEYEHIVGKWPKWMTVRNKAKQTLMIGLKVNRVDLVKDIFWSRWMARFNHTSAPKAATVFSYAVDVLFKLNEEVFNGRLFGLLREALNNGNDTIVEEKLAKRTTRLSYAILCTLSTYGLFPRGYLYILLKMQSDKSKLSSILSHLSPLIVPFTSLMQLMARELEKSIKKNYAIGRKVENLKEKAEELEFMMEDIFGMSIPSAVWKDKISSDQVVRKREESLPNEYKKWAQLFDPEEKTWPFELSYDKYVEVTKEILIQFVSQHFPDGCVEKLGSAYKIAGFTEEKLKSVNSLACSSMLFNLFERDGIFPRGFTYLLIRTYLVDPSQMNSLFKLVDDMVDGYMDLIDTMMVENEDTTKNGKEDIEEDRAYLRWKSEKIVEQYDEIFPRFIVARVDYEYLKGSMTINSMRKRLGRDDVAVPEDEDMIYDGFWTKYSDMFGFNPSVHYLIVSEACHGILEALEVLFKRKLVEKMRKAGIGGKSVEKENEEDLRDKTTLCAYNVLVTMNDMGFFPLGYLFLLIKSYDVSTLHMRLDPLRPLISPFNALLQKMITGRTDYLGDASKDLVNKGQDLFPSYHDIFGHLEWPIKPSFLPDPPSSIVRTITRMSPLPPYFSPNKDKSPTRKKWTIPQARTPSSSPPKQKTRIPSILSPIKPHPQPSIDTECPDDVNEIWRPMMMEITNGRPEMKRDKGKKKKKREELIEKEKEPVENHPHWIMFEGREEAEAAKEWEQFEKKKRKEAGDERGKVHWEKIKTSMKEEWMEEEKKEWGVISHWKPPHEHVKWEEKSQMFLKELETSMGEFFRLNVQSTSLFARKCFVYKKIESNANDILKKKKVSLLIAGSSLNSLSTWSSNLDIVIAPDTVNMTVCDLRQNCLFPICNLIQNNMDAKVVKEHMSEIHVVVECEGRPLSIALRIDPGAVFFSRLVVLYEKLDDRFSILYHSLYKWMVCTVQPGLFSSFALSSLLIHFLQCGVSPSVLPCLQSICPSNFLPDSHATVDCYSPLKPPPPKTQNTQSVSSLLISFFLYYSIFNFNEFAISIRQGKAIPRSLLDVDISSLPEISIEHPLDGSYSQSVAMSCATLRMFIQEEAEQLIRTFTI